MTEQYKIKEIDNLFQFVITLSVFLIGYVDILFRFVGLSPSAVGNSELPFGSFIALFTLSYFFFKILKFNLSKNYVYWLHILLLTELVVMPVPIVIIAKYKNNISTFQGLLFYLSLNIFLWISVMLLLLLLIQFLRIYIFKK